MRYQENVQTATVCDMKQQANESQSTATRVAKQNKFILLHISLCSPFFHSRFVLFRNQMHLIYARKTPNKCRGRSEAQKKRNNNVASKDTKLIYYCDLMFYASFLPCVCASCDEHRLRFYPFVLLLLLLLLYLHILRASVLLLFFSLSLAAHIIFVCKVFRYINENNHYLNSLF